GGAPITLGQLAAVPYGATWSKIGRNAMIAFGVSLGGAAIQAVSDSGGAIQTLLTGDQEKEGFAEPQLLADGKHVLFVSLPRGDAGTGGQVVVQSLDGKDRRN